MKMFHITVYNCQKTVKATCTLFVDILYNYLLVHLF